MSNEESSRTSGGGTLRRSILGARRPRRPEGPAGLAWDGPPVASAPALARDSAAERVTGGEALRDQDVLRGQSPRSGSDRVGLEGTTLARPASPSPAGGREAADAWDGVLELFERACADDAVAAMMAQAGVVVRLRASDLRDTSVVIACDGRFELRDDSGGAPDVELALATADLQRLAEGRLRAAMAIASGRASYRGPVRQFLRLLPVVQALESPPVAVGSAHANTGDVA